MIYAPHTLELSLTIQTNEFNRLQSKAYKKAESKHRVYKKNGVCYDEAFAKQGIKIEYHDNTYKKKIKFIVNPTRVFGGNDMKKLWKPNGKHISELLYQLEEYIEEYFDSSYNLNDFKLTRIDFTVNIDVGDRKKVSAYIKVLHNIGKVKGFAPKYDKNDDRIDPDLSFDLEGKSNGIEFTAYDKEAESNKDYAKGILRMEVRLKRQKSIRKHTDETITSQQIKTLAENSEAIFLDTFTDIVPFGDFYKKREAVELIKEKVAGKKLREKMLRFIELIPKKKSLYLAQKELNDRNIEKIIKMFAAINVSPVTISKRHNIKFLENLYSYLGVKE